MNPSQPTTADMQTMEQVFFRQMQRRTRLATSQVAQARAHQEAGKSREQRMLEHVFLRSFDFQFSDQWTST